MKNKKLKDMLELAKVSEAIENGFGQDSPLEQDLEQNSTSLKGNVVENKEGKK